MISWQPSLFDAGEEPSFDASYGGLTRTHLDPKSWIDYVPGWVRGADSLFGYLLKKLPWAQRSRRMYDDKVLEPRLTAGWQASTGEALDPPILESMRASLSARYGVEFDSAGFNLYRDGRDSVAWHGDHIRKEVPEPVVALVSLGAERRFLLRPAEGGPSRALTMARGDLLVTGGRTQRDWEHSVPKTAAAGPRISIAFRHDLDPSAYRGKTVSNDPG